MDKAFVTLLPVYKNVKAALRRETREGQPALDSHNNARYPLLRGGEKISDLLHPLQFEGGVFVLYYSFINCRTLRSGADRLDLKKIYLRLHLGGYCKVSASKLEQTARLLAIDGESGVVRVFESERVERQQQLFPFFLRFVQIPTGPV